MTNTMFGAGDTTSTYRGVSVRYLSPHCLAHAREPAMLVFRARTDKDRSPMELNDDDRALLDFEREWWQLPGRKNDLIRARLDMSASRYYRVLHALTQRPEAAAYDPLTVRRLVRRREQARRGRIEGRRADPRSR
jgi:hypothetical protein